MSGPLENSPIVGLVVGGKTMKVPGLKVHVLTEKSLNAKLDAAKAEARELQNKKIEKLLHDNYKLSVALRNMIGGKKKK